jgi:hypothetical protein
MPLANLTPKRKCRVFLSPLHDLVFWHEQWRFSYTIDATLAQATRAVALPRNILFWMKGGDVQLCKAAREPPDPFAGL